MHTKHNGGDLGSNHECIENSIIDLIYNYANVEMRRKTSGKRDQEKRKL